MTQPIPILRILGVWALMAVAMSANGVFRELALKRAFVPVVADVISAALGIVLIVWITHWGFQPLAGDSTSQLLFVSMLMLVLTVGFEFTMGRYVDHKTWNELFANYAIWRGRLWPVVLLTLALTPFAWGRWWPTGGVPR
ncbi:MAG: hypothetical protein ABI442_09450 [Gemmatimonadaceae bacterium]